MNDDTSPFDWQAELQEMKERGLTFAQCVLAFGPETPDEQAFAAAAERLHDDGDNVCVDNECVVSGHLNGAWVSAWVWVPINEVWAGKTDNDGKPCLFRMTYRCTECGEGWQDDWSSEVDDDCPTCGSNQRPIEVSDLNLDGSIADTVQRSPV